MDGWMMDGWMGWRRGPTTKVERFCVLVKQMDISWSPEWRYINIIHTPYRGVHTMAAACRYLHPPYRLKKPRRLRRDDVRSCAARTYRRTHQRRDSGRMEGRIEWCCSLVASTSGWEKLLHACALSPTDSATVQATPYPLSTLPNFSTTR